MAESPIITNEKPTTVVEPVVADEESELRAEATKQAERVRAFKLQAAGSFALLLALACIWAISEYHNAGGWPDHFSESSGTPGTWNDWIIYPAIAWALFVGFRAYGVYARRRPTEAEVEREMERMRRRGR